MVFEEQAGLIFAPVLGIGTILGLYELILIHRDENFRGSHWIGHGFHAVVFMWIALFAIFNTDYFLQITGILDKGWPLISNPWAVRIIIGIILNFKIHATSAAIRSGGLAARGLTEHWTHTIIVSALAVTSPLYWPLLQPLLPTWLSGTGSWGTATEPSGI